MHTLKRLGDASIALVALVALSPVLLAAAIGIRLASRGPVLYRARRMARDPELSRPRRAEAQGHARAPYLGREFTMYKFRTMRTGSDSAASPITAWQDSRIFPFGQWLRATKVDELPQLFNVFSGEMSLVGPRPEAPEIVRDHYTAEDLETLRVLPGLTSPGSIYYYTHCEALLGSEATAETYVQQILPVKLALDRVYIERATLWYDLKVLIRTAVVILGKVSGRQRFPDPPELAQVHRRDGRRHAVAIDRVNAGSR